MATRFCTHCGSPNDESMKFCVGCGTALGTVSTASPASPPASPASSASVSPPAIATVPAAPVTATPPSKSGGNALKFILIAVGIFAMFAVLGIGSCVFVTWRARRMFREHVRMNDSGSSITINTPQGEIKMGQRSRPAGRGDIGGVPPYPGSTPVEGGAELSFGNMGEIAGQQYETPDSVENVVAFYKGKFAPRLNVVEDEGQYRLALADENTGVTTIDVHRDGGKTVIFIGHMGKK